MEDEELKFNSQTLIGMSQLSFYNYKLRHKKSYFKRNRFHIKIYGILQPLARKRFSMSINADSIILHIGTVLTVKTIGFNDEKYYKHI